MNSVKISDQTNYRVTFPAVLVNNLDNNNKIPNFSVTTAKLADKANTKFTFKISQSSDKHPKSLSRRKFLNLVNPTMKESPQLCNPLKILLYTDCSQSRRVLWGNNTKSLPESNNLKVTSQTPTSVSTEMILTLKEISELKPKEGYDRIIRSDLSHNY